MASASPLTDCREGIAEYAQAYLQGYQARSQDCLKYADYDFSFCGDRGGWFDAADEVHEAVFAGPDSTCGAAIAGGVSLADVHPPECPEAFLGCDHYVVDDLDSAASCIACQIAGLDRKLRHDLALPEQAPESKNEKKCIGALHKLIGKAVRTGLQASVECARTGEDPAPDCPIDVSADSKFFKMLARLEKRAAKCRDDEGTPVGSGLALLCNDAIGSPADLGACASRAAICRACLAADVANGQSHDCAAASGDSLCGIEHDDRFGVLDPGAFFVANEGDSTVTFYEPDGEYAAGTLAGSSSSVSGTPSELCVSRNPSRVLSVSRSSSTVTTLDGVTRAPANGTLAASTTVVGGSPAECAVHGERQIVYVTNEADDTVTMLNAFDGSWLRETLAASTVPVGDAPTGVAVDAVTDIAYVANSGDDTVLFLDAATGAPLYGTAGLSSFPVCAGPRWLFVQDDYFCCSPTILLVGCADGSVVALDATSGTLRETPSTSSLSEMPGAMAAAGNGGFATLPASDSILAWDLYNDWDTLDGPVEMQALPSAPEPSDLAVSVVGEISSSGHFSPADEFLLSLSRQDDIVQKSPYFTEYAMLGVSALQRSTVEVDANGWLFSNPSTGVLYAAADDAVLMLDADTGEVMNTTPLSFVVTAAYDPVRNVLYVTRGPDGITMIDGSTGDFRYGDLASSTFTCGCSYPYDVAVNSTAGRVYFDCDGYVAYMDADTGACIGGSMATTGYGAYFRCGMAADEPGGHLLVGGCQYSGPFSSGTGKVFVLDAINPQFAGGTQAASILGDSSWGIRSLAVAPTLGRLYVVTTRDFQSWDLDTGTLEEVRYSYADFSRLEVDEPHNLVRLGLDYLYGTVPNRLLYLDALTLDDVGYLNLDVAVRGIATNAATSLTNVLGGGKLVQMDPYEAKFRTNEPMLSESTFPTGPSPAAIAVVPAPLHY